MLPFQREFIEFAIAHQVLRFGRFTLKSGRISPYFFNAGLFHTGNALARLGEFYAATIQASGIDFDTLFGPAYKGIPLASATAIALAQQHHRDVPYCFNRKEAKDHGEGGDMVGAPLAGRILIVDDVITAGTAVRESMDFIAAAGAQAAGVVIALDRQEMGNSSRSAVQEIEASFGIPVIDVIGLSELVDYLDSQPEMTERLHAVREYQQQYGVR